MEWAVSIGSDGVSDLSRDRFPVFMDDDDPSLKGEGGEGGREKAGDAPADARGPTPKRGQSSVVPSPSRRKGGNRRRGDPVLDADMKRLVREVGKTKIGPDMTAVERHYSRSLTIRSLVMEFLLENDGTTWADLAELYARAANHAGCAYETAHRWVYQMTRVGAPFRLVQAIDHWLLVKRD